MSDELFEYFHRGKVDFELTEESTTEDASGDSETRMLQYREQQRYIIKPNHFTNVKSYSHTFCVTLRSRKGAVVREDNVVKYWKHKKKTR